MRLIVVYSIEWHLFTCTFIGLPYRKEQVCDILAIYMTILHTSHCFPRIEVHLNCVEEACFVIGREGDWLMKS